ncbi:unnamed protein product [Pedinophyceae sp. YPF-701]|nr:unnamed protein product [Pedinophyceae sp. YPF-701]
MAGSTAAGSDWWPVQAGCSGGRALATFRHLPLHGRVLRGVGGGELQWRLVSATTHRPDPEHAAKETTGDAAPLGVFRDRSALPIRDEEIEAECERLHVYTAERAMDIPYKVLEDAVRSASSEREVLRAQAIFGNTCASFDLPALDERQGACAASAVGPGMTHLAVTPLASPVRPTADAVQGSDDAGPSHGVRPPVCGPCVFDLRVGRILDISAGPGTERGGACVLAVRGTRGIAAAVVRAVTSPGGVRSLEVTRGLPGACALPDGVCSWTSWNHAVPGEVLVAKTSGEVLSVQLLRSHGKEAAFAEWTVPEALKEKVERSVGLRVVVVPGPHPRRALAGVGNMLFRIWQGEGFAEPGRSRLSEQPCMELPAGETILAAKALPAQHASAEGAAAPPLVALATSQQLLLLDPRRPDRALLRWAHGLWQPGSVMLDCTWKQPAPLPDRLSGHVGGEFCPTGLLVATDWRSGAAVLARFALVEPGALSAEFPRARDAPGTVLGSQAHRRGAAGALRVGTAPGGSAGGWTPAAGLTAYSLGLHQRILDGPRDSQTLNPESCSQKPPDKLRAEEPPSAMGVALLASRTCFGGPGPELVAACVARWNGELDVILGEYCGADAAGGGLPVLRARADDTPAWELARAREAAAEAERIERRNPSEILRTDYLRLGHMRRHKDLRTVEAPRLHYAAIAKLLQREGGASGGDNDNVRVPDNVREAAWAPSARDAARAGGGGRDDETARLLLDAVRAPGGAGSLVRAVELAAFRWASAEHAGGSGEVRAALKVAVERDARGHVELGAARAAAWTPRDSDHAAMALTILGRAARPGAAGDRALAPRVPCVVPRPSAGEPSRGETERAADLQEAWEAMVTRGAGAVAARPAVQRAQQARPEPRGERATVGTKRKRGRQDGF